MIGGMARNTNNYIRNSRGEYHCFDDRDEAEVSVANDRAELLRFGKKERVVAWRPVRGLVVDGVVGVGA